VIREARRARHLCVARRLRIPCNLLLAQVIRRNMAEHMPPVLGLLPGRGYVVAERPDMARAAPLKWAAAWRRRRIGHIVGQGAWQL
jgi:hypothetical protein